MRQNINICNSNPLCYRRQFFMSSEELNLFQSWKKARVADRFFLEAHPDLELTQVKANGTELTLLGYIIDPDHPEGNNKSILSGLLQKITDNVGLFKETSGFSGRWILIAYSNGSTILFSDPGGLRSIYYTDFNTKPFCCASQPGLITDILDSHYSEEAKSAFLNSSYFTTHKEYWWPSGTSLYKGIKHLIPNHYIDLPKKEIKRFWPWQNIGPIDIEEGATRSSSLLKKLLESAAKRFDLAMPVTAGLDSRTLLAATKDIREEIYYYTLIYYDLNHNSSDIRIPKRLLSSLGLHHHILDCSSTMDNDFKKIYMHNVANAHQAWGDIAFGLSKQYPHGKVCIKGNCSEIARCNYHRYEYPKTINGKNLAQLARMMRNKFAIAHFEKWLSYSQAIANESNIDILDLFHWEHKIGSWQAMSQLEWDILQETYTPFNCRDLLSIFLAVDKKYRKPPHYKLYKKIINSLWPDLLNEPINPRSFKNRLKFRIKWYIEKRLLMT